jgi:cytolysin (calcineurin-like family phosphatase)
MSGDDRSLQRLRRKLRDYIIDRHSTDVLSKSGPATATNTKLTVLIHPGSDVSVFDVLAQARPALEEAGFEFEVSTDAKALGLH